MNKISWLKFFAVIVICVFLDIILHMLTSAFSTMPADPNSSLIAELLGTEITATFWALLAFSCVAYVFYLFRNSIPGVGFMKGLRYGSAIALLWLFAMLEGVPLFGNPVINEFLVGLSDAIPVLLMNILLGVFVFKNEERVEPERSNFEDKVLTIGVFAAIFTLGRYAAYFTGIIQSGHQTSPVFTLLWTLFMGACIGIANVLLIRTGKTQSIKRQAVIFGLFKFGVNWVVFLIFMPLLFTGFLTDVLTRIILDILLVTNAGYLTSILRIDCLQKVKCRLLKEDYHVINSKS